MTATLEQARVLADTAHKVAESHKTGRERFPRHETGITVDESWEYTLPEKFQDTERRDPWLR